MLLCRLTNVRMESVPLPELELYVGFTRGRLQSTNYTGERLTEAAFRAVLDQVRAQKVEGLLKLAKWWTDGALFATATEGEVLSLPESKEAAFAVLQRAAEQGSGEALYELGTRLEEGLGVKPDASRALAMYEAAGQAGHLLGAYNEASLRFASEDPREKERAQAVWAKLADQGVGHAQLAYAATLMPTSSMCLRPDMERALRYIDLAGETGHSRLQYGIALGFHHGGPGVAKDPRRARRLFLASANEGFAPAAHIMGILNLSEDIPAALEWFEQAAGGGVVDSQINIALAYFKGELGGEKCEQDFCRAYFWALHAAQSDRQGGILAKQIEPFLPPADAERLHMAVEAQYKGR
ncbi:MAG: hypothetical protein RL077_544 [Verrucomicrobiota bacterium]|jgi:TPR repeat protein